MTLIIAQAEHVAWEAHRGQVRKFTGEPYINHPIAVAKILKAHCINASDEMITSAILHDTVEDTELSLGTIKLLFGERIARIVDGLTSPVYSPEASRHQRVAANLNHFINVDEDIIYEVHVVKLCDMIHNISDIALHGKARAAKYTLEKLAFAAAVCDSARETPAYEKFMQIAKENLKLAIDTVSVG